jgi:hypothetical protein
MVLVGLSQRHRAGPEWVTGLESKGSVPSVSCDPLSDRPVLTHADPACPTIFFVSE